MAIVTIVAPIPESLTITKPVKKAKKPVRVSDISAEESAANKSRQLENQYSAQEIIEMNRATSGIGVRRPRRPRVRNVKGR